MSKKKSGRDVDLSDLLRSHDQTKVTYGINPYINHNHYVESWQQLRRDLQDTIYVSRGIRPLRITNERDFQMYLAESLSNMGLIVFVEFPILGRGRIDLLLPQIELGIEVKMDVDWIHSFHLQAQLQKYEEALGWPVICVARSGRAMKMPYFKRFLSQRMQEKPPQSWPPYVYSDQPETSSCPK